MASAPLSSSFDEFQNRLARASDGLSQRLSQAAHFMMHHPDEVALGTAASISKAANVQPSTLVRLAHQLGYAGFSDMQAVFRHRLKARASTYEERLSTLETVDASTSREAAILAGFVSAAATSAEMLGEPSLVSRFEDAVNCLAGADRIHIIARRRAYPLAAHLAYHFAKLGMDFAVADTPNRIDEETLERAAQSDAVLAISFSPYTADTIDLAGKLHARGVPVVSITDSAMSPLTAVSTVWLEIGEADFAGFRTLTASLTIASALAVATAEQRRRFNRASQSDGEVKS